MGVDLLVLIGLPELQIGRALEHFTDAVLVLHARQFDLDAAGEFLLLQHGLGHAELVDPGAHDALGIAQGIVRFTAQSGEVIRVAALPVEHVLALRCIEDGRKGLVTGDLGVLLPEQRDEVVPRGFLPVARIGDRGVESRIVIALTEVDHQFGNAHFERYRHTALEIKTHVDLALLAFAVGLAQHRIDPVIGMLTQVLVLERQEQFLPIEFLLARDLEH